MIRRRAFIPLILVSLTGVAVAGYVLRMYPPISAAGDSATVRIQTSGDPTFNTAPAAALASYGIALSAPTSEDVPGFDASRARDRVLSMNTGVTVLEEVLGRMQCEGCDVPEGTLVWGVSVLPYGGLGGAVGPAPSECLNGGTPPSYSGFYIDFLDAADGHYYGAVGDAHPSDPAGCAPLPTVTPTVN